MAIPVLKTTAVVLLALPVLLLIAGQLGLLQGQRPTDLGVSNGRLKGLSNTPNCVSSQAGLYPGHPQANYSAIEPLQAKQANAAGSMEALARVLQRMPGITLIEQKPDYLYAQAQTRWLKFTDDVEFWFNPANQTIEMRSASRLGRKDFAANRDRLEAVRVAYQNP